MPAAHSPADLVIVADPHPPGILTERWQEQIERRLGVPAGTPAVERTRLLAVRLLGDGLWSDRSSGRLGAPQDGFALRGLALELVGGAP